MDVIIYLGLNHQRKIKNNKKQGVKIMTPCFFIVYPSFSSWHVLLNILNKFNNILQNYVNFDKMVYITERSAQ